MSIFEGLLMAHLLGDWLLQTEWQAQNKVRNWRAMLAHIAIYHGVVLAVLVFGFGITNAVALTAVVGFLAVTHIILDRRTFTQWLIRNLRLAVERPPEVWLTIAVDQALHLLLLGLSAAILTRLVPTGVP